MLDGFDEVKQEWRQEVGQWIAEVMHHYPGACFILTSRPTGYQAFPCENQPNRLRIKAFNQGQRERFIQSWYLSREKQVSAKPYNPVVKEVAKQKAANLIQQLQARTELNDLAQNPLLLNMIVNLHSVAPTDHSDLSRPIQLPQRRKELYRDIFRLQLGDRPTVKQVDMYLEAEESQQVLQSLALSMIRNNQSTLPYELLLQQIKESLQNYNFSVTPQQFLQQMVDVSELLVKRDEDYEFAHLSFQGYLAAQEVHRTHQEDLLIEHWQNPWWRETILLYAAQFNPNQLLKQLMKLGTQEAVALALTCIKETLRQVDPDIEQELKSLELEIQKLLYNPLKSYLANGQWQKANQETNRVMVQVAKKEPGELLELEDIERFPCQDLGIIDDLWVQYSGEKFGFTVQRDIWLSCGGQVGIYEPDVYENFATQVRWYDRKQQQWYKEIEFNLDTTPPGHLPTLYSIASTHKVHLFSRSHCSKLSI